MWSSGPIIETEVAPDTLTKVGRFADVQHLASSIAKQVNTGAARERVGEFEFRCRRVSAERWQLEEIIEAHNAEAGGALENEVQQISGGANVGKRAVAGLMGQAEVFGERP
jgi:hypothetical protein